MPGQWLEVEDLPENLQETEFAQEAVDAASQLMWSLSGRKYVGISRVTERYVATQYVPTKDYPYPELDYSGGPAYRYWLPAASLSTTRLRLRGAPVVEVQSVIDSYTGLEMDPETYYIVDNRSIQFTEPIGSDYDIRYRYGQEPPVMGKMAARALAIEFAKLWGGLEEECALPDRVTSVTRQGVSWVLLDNQDFIDDLKTGIYAVDLFLKSVNPDKARVRARVFSPDIPRGRRVTPPPTV